MCSKSPDAMISLEVLVLKILRTYTYNSEKKGTMALHTSSFVSGCGPLVQNRLRDVTRNHSGALLEEC
jgi:hypothetical protein